MFNNRKNTYPVFLYGEIYRVEPEVGKLIDKLRDELRDTKHELTVMECELKRIKPIIEHKDFKPAVSKDCADCQFVVKSPWDHEVLGCRKDNLCEDFRKKEEQ